MKCALIRSPAAPHRSLQQMRRQDRVSMPTQKPQAPVWTLPGLQCGSCEMWRALPRNHFGSRVNPARYVQMHALRPPEGKAQRARSGAQNGVRGRGQPMRKQRRPANGKGVRKQQTYHRNRTQRHRQGKRNRNRAGRSDTQHNTAETRPACVKQGRSSTGPHAMHEPR